MSEKIYLRPVGFLWGANAKSIVEAGQAIMIAGGPTACTGFEIIEGTAANHRRSSRSASDLAASADAQIEQALQHISATRPPICAMNFNRPLIMGIVNVTPDSFSDGGDFHASDEAIAHARRITEEGADFIDLGGESTRPGAAPVDVDEEMRRVIPVIKAAREFARCISIDTRNAAVMDVAAQAGAAMINDVSALGHDPAALKTASKLDLPVVLMHAQGDPRSMQDAPFYDDVLLEVYDYLEARIDAAIEAGIPRAAIIADPGIGFGKTLDHNLALLRGMSIFHGLGVPIMLGASRKRFLGILTDESDPKKRVSASISAALAAAAQGVQMFRVHDVRETTNALTIWHAAMNDRQTAL